MRNNTGSVNGIDDGMGFDEDWSDVETPIDLTLALDGD